MSIGQNLSYIFGIISNSLWVLVFIPQIYQNYKNKNADAISISLLYCLILGDFLSIISASYKNLNPVIIYSAIYHIFLDVIIISQIIYYRYKYSYNYNNDEEIQETIGLLGDRRLKDCYHYYLCYLSNIEFMFVFFSSLVVLSCQLIIIYVKELSMGMADILAWSATIVFISSRIPQIILNYNRSSTQGLSLSSFIIINFANLLFFLSIVILLVDIEKDKYSSFLLHNIQWIIGATCTTFMDVIIFYQFWCFSESRQKKLFLKNELLRQNELEHQNELERECIYLE